MSEYSLELVSLTKKYGKVTALKNINLQVRDGDFFFLLGPSGCGKTTLLKIIGGLEDPTEGMVRIMGEDVTNLRANKRPTATVFQEWALFPHMSVFENIAFGMRMHKVPKEDIKTKVDELLELIQMQGLEKRMAYELSGGQQQRVAIARSLAIEPDILLLDEPLSNLDLALRQQMRVELVRLHEKIGKTFIYVTHDQTEAMTMGDNLVVMDRGRIEQVGSPVEIYRHPRNEYVAGFIGETNKICGVIEEVEPETILTTEDGLRFKVDCRDGSLAKGSPAVMIVRPEHTMVINEPTADNQFEMVVETTSFFGANLRLQGHTVVGRIPFFIDIMSEADMADSVCRGSRITLGVEKNHALCFRR